MRYIVDGYVRPERRCQMTLGIRKVIVLGLVVGVFLTGNALLVASWLADKGVIDCARNIRAEYLTGTAITII